jgi:hypothetical protein
MLGTPWLSGGAGGRASRGGGDWCDPFSENSAPFISGTVSSGGGGGDMASAGGCGDVALDDAADLTTWFDDSTGLHGPMASGAMSTRNREPGLEAPDPMDTRSMAHGKVGIDPAARACELPLFAVSVIDADIEEGRVAW